MPNPSNPETIYEIIPAYSRATYSVLVAPPLPYEVAREAAAQVSLTGCTIQTICDQFLDAKDNVGDQAGIEAKADQVAGYLAANGIKTARRELLEYSGRQDLVEKAA